MDSRTLTELQMLIGIPVYPDVDLLDVAGPFEMFSWAGFNLVLAAEVRGMVACRGGLTIQADVSFADAPKFDVLWTPGGDPAALAKLMGDPRRVFLDFLIRQSGGAEYVCSVCEGALLLAAAGLLDGYRATTHWAFIRCLTERFPKVKVAPGHPHRREHILGPGRGSRAHQAAEGDRGGPVGAADDAILPPSASLQRDPAGNLLPVASGDHAGRPAFPGGPRCNAITHRAQEETQ
jgi:cyclohexyl-isocyanide hydratase